MRNELLLGIVDVLKIKRMKFIPKPKKKIESNKPKSYLSLDIGTEYVKTVLFLKSPENEIEVIGYNRKRQKESSMYAAFIINLRDVIDTLDKSIGASISMAQELNYEFEMPKEVIIGIAGELVQGVTVMVNSDRESPNSAINEKELDKLIAKVKKFTFPNTKEDIAEEIGIKSSLVEEVETYINSVYIDGVRVTNPLGFKGSEIVYRVFSTFAPKIYLDSINQVASELNLRLARIVVEPYAISLGVKDLRSNNSSAIVIDIGGGTTDVALVKNGDIIGTKMFAIGGSVFTKRVAKELNVTYEEAEQKKIEYSNGKLDKSDASKLNAIFTQDVKVWLTGVELCLEEFEEVDEYPSTIYLCGGGALLPEIQEGLITHPWLQLFNFKKYPKVNFIFPTNLRDILDKTKNANMPEDVAPLALARMILE